MLIAVVGGALAYRTWLDQQPKAMPVADCNLNRQACSATWSGGDLTLSLSPQPVPAAKPLTARVQVRGAGVDAVEIELAGAEMDMGPNQRKLSPDPSAAGEWQGQTTIPVCVTGRMPWLAIVRLHRNGKAEATAFRFYLPEQS